MPKACLILTMLEIDKKMDLIIRLHWLVQVNYPIHCYKDILLAVGVKQSTDFFSVLYGNYILQRCKIHIAIPIRGHYDS